MGVAREIKREFGPAYHKSRPRRTATRDTARKSPIMKRFRAICRLLKNPARCESAGRGVLLLALLLAGTTALVGCNRTPTGKAKPTTDELRQIQAAVEPPKVNPLAPLANSVEKSLSPVGDQGNGRRCTRAHWRERRADLDHDAERCQSARAGRSSAGPARIGPEAKEAVPALIARLDDPDEEVRQASARALGQVGPAAAPAVPALISLIDSASTRSSTVIPATPINPQR